MLGCAIAGFVSSFAAPAGFASAFFCGVLADFDAAAACGLDWARLDAAERTESDRLDAAIEANEAAQAASGHWGVPLMVFDGEPFFGHDRIDVLLWRLGQHGLTRR